MPEPLDVAGAEPQRLGVQRLLEERAREARVAERRVALAPREDRAQRLLGTVAERVLRIAGEAAEDRDELVGRVVGELDLAREPRAQPGIRLEEPPHQARVAGDDHDEAVAVVLHPLQQRLDRLVAEVEPVAVARERIGLVDEEHAVERLPDDAVGLDRGQPDVLPDEPGAIDLDELAALEQPHRAIHLREQPRDRRLAGARVAEEDEVLRRRDLRQARLLAPRLDAQERDERLHLLLDRLEPRQRVELGEQLLERPRRLLPAQDVEVELLADLQAQLLAERPQRLERILRHGPGRYPRGAGLLLYLSQLMVQSINDSMTVAGRLRPVLLRLDARAAPRDPLARRDGRPGLACWSRSSITRGSPPRLAPSERVSAPGMSGHLKRLEAAGLIERTRASDRRRVGLFLTDAGDKVLRSVRQKRTAWLVARLEQLEPEERERIEAAIDAAREAARERMTVLRLVSARRSRG